MRISAGIMSPAASWTMSPGTSWPSGTSLAAPSRTTVAVTLIMALSFAAASSARVSCTNRNTTPKTTMISITVPARGSPVKYDTEARINSRMTSGFMHAWPKSLSRP